MASATEPSKDEGTDALAREKERTAKTSISSPATSTSLHQGHLRLLRFAAELGGRLVVESRPTA